MTITCMNPILYNAAAQGNIMAFKNHKFKRPLEAILTPNKNTILHIFITTLENGIELTEKNFVGDILDMCPSLLCQVNVKDETSLHIAARYGHANIIRVLIQHARYGHNQDLGSGAEAVWEMLRMVNKERDTALHEAVRYNHREVVKLLIKEDPDFSYSVNDAGETPLYIAVERNYENLVLEILKTCNSPAYDGPLGRTALHAAVFWDNKVTIKAILEKIGGGITKKADQEGWTPLHLAAYSNWWWSTQLLLEHDSQVAYMKDKEGRTALHIAAHRGNNRVMQSIIGMCPDCCELVDNIGRNVLHFAVEGDVCTVSMILKNSSLSNLLNEKNAEGNTPLHHQYSRYSEDVNGALMHHPRVDKMGFNKNNLNAYQVALTSAKLSPKKKMDIATKLRSRSRRVFLKEDENNITLDDIMKDEVNWLQARRKEFLEKAAETHLVVAALITTVTFAAAITMPGGFVGTGGDPHYEGSAVLRRNTAFKAFIITDAISLVLSSSAVVTHLLMPLLLIKHSESDETRYDFLSLAFKFILMAMGAMVLAFITGAYAVLVHSLDLLVTTCVIGSCFFLILYIIYELYKKNIGFSRIYSSLYYFLCY
ncbi:protein ACCELERATED CELL DEATH 6-like [Juglans microcarpa x Juglans regia]|uniref:protein ACCELERATED CELL DEATH 6-like n=1 Tax=Juglans microcarpa x Juglans regia TaxID=2249226 RepID=UPI001B7EAB44|nr:protein ACCELERATED CELL DEATH 6-like [Juglans microcarpa x Juglans regia]XP_040989441.1 protein ACCELERATED CELL DEATH 6-like [Juglans microcarpa x Juglans regia]XP_040989442.1 protein ACCELERATED CELL DEATH 6-like [Juglans microcarpa x Juglans regia]